MGQWLILVFLISELSLAISSVIVIKLDEGDEDAKQIASIIEAKIHKQEERLMKLETILDSLNSTFQGTYAKHDRNIKRLTRVTQSQDDKITSINSTFVDVYNSQQTEIKNLTKQNKELQGNIQLLNSRTKGNEKHLTNSFE